MIVRTWNVFHGNAMPPQRHAFLAEMVRLVTSDRPAIVCLQELPVWSLSRLETWSGMTASAAVAARPLLGSFPISLEVERRVTDLDHGLLRSAVTGQANAILVGAHLLVVDRRAIPLNPLTFRRQEARRLGLRRREAVAWGKNRRVCQAVRIRHEGSTLVIANLHATGSDDPRLADAELLRAASFVDGFAAPHEPIVLAGDFNATVEGSPTLRELTTSEWGFDGPTPTGIDHVLVRGLEAGPPVSWSTEQRLHGGTTLSDHAPVERIVS